MAKLDSACQITHAEQRNGGTDRKTWAQPRSRAAERPEARKSRL